MSMWTHPNPLVQDILEAGRMSDAEAAAVQRAPARAQSLAAVFPACNALPVWFDAITVPAGLPVPAAGISYMYGLRRFRVGRNAEITADSVFYGAYFQMRPTDWNGKGTTNVAGSAASWGDNRGERAAIIIGRNLPAFVEGNWSQIKLPLPGVAAHTAGVVNTDRTASFLMSQTFPPGDWGDTAPQLALVPRALAPAASRLVDGSTLDVALVLNGTQVNTISNTGMAKTIIGYANIDVYVASTVQDVEFRS